MTPVARRRGGNPLLEVRDEIWRVVLDERGVERPIEPRSRLAREVRTSTHEIARHFLGELPMHCNMLATAVADALTALDRLEPRLAFSGVLVVRGLLEAAADLYWLSDTAVDASERARRTFLVYLRQREAEVRQLEEMSTRLSTEFRDEGIDLAEAIAEGWEALKLTAEGIAAVGFALRTSRKPGSRYSIGEPKPPIGDLVDRLITDYLGKTGVRLYTSYSSTAHAEGGGLGALLVSNDQTQTADGTRFARGLDSATWEERIIRPATTAAKGAFLAWATLAYQSSPEQLLQA